MTRKTLTKSCTNYSSRDAFRNSILAGMAGAAGTGIIAAGLSEYYGNVALKKGLEKACEIWSANPSNYSDWLYPLSYYETVKNLVINHLRNKIEAKMINQDETDEEHQIVNEYEKALYSVPEYVNLGIITVPWGPSKMINPSGQLCNLPAYNLKHNLIEISEGNARSMKNLNNSELDFKPLNETVRKILKGEIKVGLPKSFKKNMKYGDRKLRNNMLKFGAGSVLPFPGTAIIGGAYAQPSFGFGGSIVPFPGTDMIGGSYAQPSFGFGNVVKRKPKRIVKRVRNRSLKTNRTQKNNSKKIQLKSIKKSTKPDKKLMATFIMPNGRTKTTHFGAAGMSDFTKHKDPARKQRYINRHRKRELKAWKDPTSAGALSLYILWNKPTLKASIADYKKRFKSKLF